MLRILRGVRARHRIETSSPVNLFMATGESLVAQAQRELLSRAETLERP